MSEPVYRTFSEQQLSDAAVQFMQENYGEYLNKNPDWYHTRLGVLMEFSEYLKNFTPPPRPKD